MVVKHYPLLTQARSSKLVKTICLAASALVLASPAYAGNALEGSPLQAPEASQVAVAQARTTKKVVGAITDSKTGEPLVGANVLIKGTTPPRGTTTDLDGRFEIEVSASDVLVISSLGYTNKEIKIGNQRVLSITLAEDAKLLGDVVITAFGTGQKKETLVGSIQSVRPSDFKMPVANLSSAFAGRLAGVIAYQRSGEPGSNGADFYVRGVSTMSGAVNPLIILDGVEISQGDLNALDPEVIESFSVLKDATTSAMYGTRGANGVLIIKTRSGADLDKPIIGVRLEGYINTPVRVPKIANATTFMRMFNESLRGLGVADAPYSEEKIRNTELGTDPYLYPNVDWYSELFKTSTFNQRANFNLRGGTNKITYFMNLNAIHETGMLRGRSKDFFSFDNNIDVWRYAFQNNIDFNISKDAKIGLNLNVQLNDNRGPVTAADGGGGIDKMFDAVMQNNAVDAPIMYPSYGDDWYHWGNATMGSTPIVNPLAVATAGYKDSFASTVVANLTYDQKLDFIVKGLSFKGLMSFKNWSMTTNSRHQGYNAYMLTGTSVDAKGNTIYEQSASNPVKPVLNSKSSRAGDRRFYLQGYFDYNRSFGDHNISAMLLYNQDEYNNSVINNDDLIASLPKRKMGFAARLTYDYARRYILELSAGYNGSENFAEGHRWGLFPAVGASWNVSQEKFWKPLSKVISSFKLRGSYGLVGNDQIGGARFIYMPIVSLNNTPPYTTGYDGVRNVDWKGPTYSRLANNAITWEVGAKLNVGADIRLFDMINLTIDGFNEIRSNIFQQKQTIPNSFGTADTKIYGNYAKVKSWGFDGAIDFGKEFSKDFSMQFRGTFTYARNRVLEYDEAPGLRPALRRVGHSIHSIWGYQADGLYIDQADIAANPASTLGNIAIAPGDIKYVDQPATDGTYDNQITADDRIVLGYPTVPEIVYGFGPTMRYKNFDFSFFFQGQARVSLMMSDFHPFGHQERRNVLQWIADDYWSIDNQNPNAQYPRLTKLSNNHNAQSSSHWLRNADFLKLKNIELGYTYKNARLYVSATNVFSLSSFKLWDPEMGGGKGMSYPLQRTFNIGLQITFNNK